MSKHQPWTDGEAEKAASIHDSKYYLEDLANGEGTFEEVEDAVREAFLAGIAWAAEQIAKSPTIYYRDSDHEERVIVASPECFELDTHEAKLVGVRPIEKGNEK